MLTTPTTETRAICLSSTRPVHSKAKRRKQTTPNTNQCQPCGTLVGVHCQQSIIEMRSLGPGATAADRHFLPEISSGALLLLPVVDI